MANLSLVRVNQKLAQAMILLEQAKIASLNPSESLLVNAMKESIAFHLVCAYQHYLREIAENYFIKNVEGIASEADLVLAFQSAKKHPAEANELVVLRQTAHSWLQQLHVYYESLWRLPAPANSVESPPLSPNENLIQLISIEQDNIEQAVKPEQVDLGVMLTWHQAFVALVVRQRETSAEF